MSEKIAIVTGAASGIGLAVARALAGSGHKVVLADVNREAGTREAQKLGGLFVAADLSERADCKALVDAALDSFGRVDILVNNAGIQHVSPVEEFPEDKWDFMIALMLTAPFSIENVPKVVRGDYLNVSLMVDLTLSAVDNGILSGTGVSGMLRALEQAWGRDPETMIPDVRFTPNPHSSPNGPLVERGE